MSCKSVPIFYLILYSLQYLPILLSSDTPNQLLNWRGWDKLRVHAFILSHSSSVCILMIPWTVAFQVPLSMGFSRQEYWSGLPCPPPGDLPNPGIEPVSLASPALAGAFFTTSAPWEAHFSVKLSGLSIEKKIKYLNVYLFMFSWSGRQSAWRAMHRGS